MTNLFIPAKQCTIQQSTGVHYTAATIPTVSKHNKLKLYGLLFLRPF